MKTLDLRSEGSRTPTIHCKIQGCPEATREGKPYCPKHVAKNTYVARLMQQIKSAEEEKQKVAQQNSIRPIKADSLVLSEIRNYLLANSERTVFRIAKDLRLDSELVRVYIRYLVKRENAVYGLSHRNITTVRMPR